MELRAVTAVSVLACLLAAPACAAPALEPLARIAAIAEAALDAGQGAQATVDPGVRLARCLQVPQARVVRAGTVEVACGTPAWKLYVPVRVANQRRVLVLRQPVAAGQVLAAGDLELVERDLARVAQGVLVDPEAAVGRVARRHLQAGSLLTTADLQAGKVVRRGDTVDLVTRRGTVEIRVQARATRDAAVGDTLQVENLSTRRVVQGTVAPDGTVIVK